MYYASQAKYMCSDMDEIISYMHQSNQLVLPSGVIYQNDHKNIILMSYNTFITVNVVIKNI